MAMQEIDALGAAIAATEKEIFTEAFGQEEVAHDETGDRTIEQMGEGLEGQHEPDDDDDDEVDEAEVSEESEGEDEEQEVLKTEEAKTEPKEPVKAETVKPEQPEGRVPSGKLREANEKARVAQAERDTLKGQNEKLNNDFTTLSGKLDLALRQIDDLRRTPQVAPKPVEPQPKVEAPDLFEDPKGFVDHLTNGFRTELSRRDEQIANQRVETSMAIAHAFHKGDFEEAFKQISTLDPRNPDDQMTVRRIYNSPNPGEALVGWHKRNKTLAEVGDDPTAFRTKVQAETREALMKDPEFRKQLLADLRAEANRGDDGNPRTAVRLPKSLNGAQGSNLRADADPHQYDDSDSAVFNSAWR